ncbi:MAG: Uma2 family endonuclease [Isosphaeraceae bacterium]
MTAPGTIRTPPDTVWTVADLYRRFGPISFERIRQDPPPGLGTVEDVVRLNDHEDRLYELVDGILVRKIMGHEQSYLAVRIGTVLSIFVEPRGLGWVVGEGGMMQLAINLVRIPDVSFISWDRVPGDEFPKEPVPLLVPDLVVEVISRGNTSKEMEEKLKEYFEKGVRLVWFVRPRGRVIDVYTAPDRFTRLTVSATLDGGDVLPGFSVRVGELFRMPRRPDSGKGQPKKNGDDPEKKKRPMRGR